MMTHRPVNTCVRLLLVVSMLLIAKSASAQWTGYSVLSDQTIGQPSFAVFQGQLYLAWTGTDSQKTVNVMSSSDGMNYGNKVTLSGYTSDYGPAIAAFSGCNHLMLAYTGRGGTNSVNITKSADGVNWTSQFAVGINGASAPVLSDPLGVAVRNSGGVPDALGMYTCDPSSASDFFYTCFVFNNGFCIDFSLNLNGAPAMFEHSKGITAANISKKIYTGCNGCSWTTTNDWSNHGPYLTKGQGFTYLAWLGSGGGINIRSSSGSHVISSDWSSNTPALAVFNGELFVAWRGGSNNIIVAKTNLF